MRRKPLRDGTPVCCGDFCQSNIGELIGLGDDTNPGPGDMSVFAHDKGPTDKQQKQEKKCSQPVAGKSILYKSVFLARMDADGKNAAVDDAMMRQHLERRVLPQVESAMPHAQDYC